MIFCFHEFDHVIPEQITPNYTERVSLVFCRGCRWIHTAQISCETFQVSARNCAAAAVTQSREKLRLADPNTSARRAAGLQKSLTSLWLLGFQLLLVNGGRREIQISCFFLWAEQWSCVEERVYRTYFCAWVFVHEATRRLWLAFCLHTAQVVAHRPSDDASPSSCSVSLHPAMWKQYLLLLLKRPTALPSLQRGLNRKWLPPSPPFRMPKRVDPQGTPRQRHEEMAYKSKASFLKENPGSLKWLNNIFVII